MKRVLAAILLALVSTSAWAASITVTVTPGANAVSHRIEKQIGAGAYAPLVTLPMPTVTYSDTVVSVGEVFCYRSVTISAVDEAAPSAPCCVALLAAGPSSVQCVVNP